MWIALLIAAGILVAVLLAVLVIWRIRTRNFKPNPNKQQQQQQLNADLEPTGFAYERRGDYFYSLMNCWQRETGYCKLYDEGAPLFNMIMDCEPVTFSYGGKRWLIELWKGQYGITTGAEIGVYNTTREDIHSEKFTGTFYENISDAERMPMSFVLRRNGKRILKRRALHWWITAFKLGAFSDPASLTMDAKIKFPNRTMCAAFVQSLRQIGYQKREFSVRGTNVSIRYTRPHSPQPESQQGARAAIVQKTNETNCQLYATATTGYPDTLDQLEYIKTAVPELYHFFLESLYAKGFFAAFEWIRKLLYGHHPKPEPCPEPCPPPCPEPCPPPCPEPCPPPCPEPCPPPCPEPCPPPCPEPCPPPCPEPCPPPCPEPCPPPCPEPCPPPCPEPCPQPAPRPCPPPACSDCPPPPKPPLCPPCKGTPVRRFTDPPRRRR